MKKIYLVLLFGTVFIGAKSQSTTLVISQVYGGGGNVGATYTNDFIEIFNKGTISISLNGYSVQYASAAGNFGNLALSTNLPNVTLLPGQYFLIQQASGGAVGVALPTPDLTGTVSMAAGAGKVALVNTTTLLSATTCPSSATIIDFVGYGTTANCFEGTASTTAPSSSLSVFRKLSGCQDTQDNSSDFTAATPSARNTATPLNPCSGSCTVPSQNASMLRMASSTPTSLSLLFNRGNGTGAIVLCKAASAVNSTPVNGTTYTANSIFGSGSQIGTGNFVVHSTTLSGVVGFNVTGLTAGTKYFFSVFEYNDPGKCYTSTGLTGSFTVGATMLKPGDMVIIGWDADAASPGQDKYYLMNTVDIAPGTGFQLVNSRFEAGAAANVRTNRWFGGGNDPYQDPGVWNFEYTGAGLSKGSIIAFQTDLSSATNFSINGVGVAATVFNPVLLSGVGNLISVPPDGDQIYITQGTFRAFGTATIDRYNLLDGLVIHGITSAQAWIPLTSPVSAATTGGATRQSRIPPDILCINTEFAGSNHYANYNRANGQTGTKAFMLGKLKNVTNWTTATGTAGVDDIITGDPSFSSSTYTINASAADGNWNGTASNDWFDCSNWEGLHVPDSTSAVIINPIPAATNNCDINTTTSAKAVQFTNFARADSLTILNGAVLSLTGAGTEKLKLENSLTINTNGLLQFENNANSLTDTLFIHGTLRDQESSNNYSSPYGFQPGLGTVKMEDTRFASNPAALLKPTGFTNRFYRFAMNNSRDVSVKGITEINSTVNLQSGYLTITAPDGKLSLKPGCSITSPVNVYGDLNKGYKNSFVNGKLYIETNSGFTNPVFPIGKVSATDTLFAPVEITKSASNAFTYDAEYFQGSYSDLTVDLGQLDHVSGLEYWSINSSTPGIAAKSTVKLSWRPSSLVGNGIPANDAAALDDLVVSHYLDDDAGGPIPFLWHIEGGDMTVMPKGAGSTVNYGTLTTNLSNSPYTDAANTIYFTLGTKSPFNILPVKFLDFTATPKLNEVSLKWITKEEKGLLYYELEQSKDAIRFSKIDKVIAANGVDQNTYTAKDLKPFTGWNYYRLKIVEANGKVSYSVVVKAWIGVTKQLLLYPNPAQKEIKIILPGSRSTSTIAIVNSNGQVVKQLTTTDQSATINIEFLNKGVYFVKIFTDQQAFVQKFSKQ